MEKIDTSKPIDLDDYVNHLHNIIESLKLEVKTQRKEIAALREERKMILNNDNVPGRCIDG
jgi:hypothetical protein